MSAMTPPTCWVLDILVVLAGLEIRERGVAVGGEWHDLPAPVDQTFVIDLTKHPPSVCVCVCVCV